MQFNRARGLFFSLLVIGLAAPPAAAAPVVDQTSPVADPIPFTWALGGPSEQMLYQSVTVGIDGRLGELRLPIGCESGRVILEVYTADASTGLPAAGAVPRLTRSYPANFFPEIVTVDFQTLPLGGRAAVTAGETIVFALSNPTGSCGIAWGVAGDGYTDGTGHAADSVNGFVPVPLSLSGTDDLPFVTVVRRPGPP